MELETKKLLGYTLKILDTEDFREFYDTCNSFNDFSRKAFLKSIGIPASYFLEQPDATQEELKDNKEENITKYSGKVILLLEKDGVILNCVRTNRDTIYSSLDFLTPSDEIEKKLIPIRTFIRNGYISLFLPSSDLKEGVYNTGLFIDYPIMLNKEPVVNKGSYSLPDTKNEFGKIINTEKIFVDNDSYQTLDMLIEESIEDSKNSIKIIDAASEILLLKETDELLINLYEVKAITKPFISKISKYINKNDILISSQLDLIELIVSYENNISTYKPVINMRNSLLLLKEVV